MKKLLIGLGVTGAILLALNCLSFTQQADFKTLDEVKVMGDFIVMKLSGQTKYHAFKISNPPRIVVEFTNTEHNWKQKELEVKKQPIRRIRSGQFQNEPVKIARVVVDLYKIVEYELKGKGNEVTLILNPNEKDITEDTAEKEEEAAKKAPEPAKETAKPATVAKPAATTPAKPAAVAKPVAPPVKTEVAKAPVAPKAPVVAPTIKKPAKKIVKKKIKSKKKIKKTRKKAKKKAAKKQKEAAKEKEIALPKDPVTLDFEEADIKDVLRVLSMKSGINIIYGPDVKGTVTLRLENVPFDKAFETILSLNGLVSQRRGANILRVVTPKTISDERSKAITFTKIFPLNYAKAEDIKANLDSVRSAEGRRGNISVDARTNSLIITDTPEGLVSLENLINELDKRPHQVLIEAKIIEVVLTDSFDMGIQWQYAGTPYDKNNTKIDLGRSEAKTASVGAGVATENMSITEVKSIAEGGTGVSFPAAPASGQAGTITFGIVSNNNYLTGVLTTLSQKGLSKLLSNPKVTTINNQEAKILVGQKIPYTTATTISGGGASTANTEFLSVGIELVVTPTINIDQRITLKVHPSVSLFIRADPSGPVTGTREAETTVLVKNGETVVIGGLISEEDRKLGTQVPLLGDLPVIGHLFRRDYKSKERTELLVFITPQILD